MKTLLFAMVLSGLAAAQEKPKATLSAPAAISRETVLEFEMSAAREKEASEKLQAVYDLLMEPIKAARQAAFERACAAAGIPVAEGGRPVCEVDVKAGVVRRAAPKEGK